MSTYESLKGLKVKYLSADTSGDRLQEGEIFYNSSDFNLKSHIAVGAWSAGANMLTARRNMGSGETPTTAGLVFGGYNGTAATTVTEEYDGTGFSNGGNMGTARYQFNGFGVQTAAVGAGGYVSPGHNAEVEEYNGSSWSEVNNLPAARRGLAGFGTLTAGVIAGGVPNLNTSLHYDGTNWTAGGNIPAGTDRTNSAGAGTQTAGLLAAGDTTQAFEYDGSSWTNGGVTNSVHDGGADTGLQTAAIISSGHLADGTGRTTACETYDGTSFSTSSGTLAQGRYGAGRGGSSGTAAFVCGGDNNPGLLGVTEEFNISTSTVTGAAWASGGNTSHRTGGRLNFGTQTAALSGGGLYVPNPGYTNEATTEEYNGSSWTAGGNMPGDKARGAGFGVLTAGVVAGGTVGNTSINTSFEYDGSSWTAGGNLNVARRYQAGFGTLTAGAICGGYPSPTDNGTETEEYDGSSWTAGGALNSKRQTSDAAGGIQTAAITFGGEGPGGDPAGRLATSEEYNGTAWSEGNDLNTPTNRNSGGGTSVPTTLSLGGQSATFTPGTAQVEQYNGTSWVTTANMAVARSQIGKMSGNSASGLVNNGANASDSYIVTTEEFTGETTAVNAAKTIDFD